MPLLRDLLVELLHNIPQRSRTGITSTAFAAEEVEEEANHVDDAIDKVKEDVDGKTEFIRDRMNAKGPNAPPLNTSWTGEGPNALVILPIGEPVRDLDPGTVGRLL